MISKIDKEKILNVLLKYGVFVLSFCFLISFFPNICGSIPKLSFLVTNQFARLAFRAVGALVFVAYSLFIFLFDKLYRINKIYYFIFGFLCIIIFVDAAVRFGQPFSYSYIENYYYHKIVVTYEFGLLDIFTYFFNAFYSLFFVFAFLFVFKPELKRMRHINAIFYGFIGLMVLLVFYSLIFEKDLYLSFLKGKDTLQIKSLFPSKNAFSLFLFQAFVLSVYLASASNKLLRSVLIVLSVIFAIEILFSGSKIATLCIFVFGAILAFFGSISVYKKSKVASIVTFSIPLAMFVFVLLFLYSPGFRGSGILNVLYNRFVGVETDSRLTIFSSYFTNVNAKGVIFGYSYQVKTFISMCSSSSTVFVNVDDFHNAFLQILATYGVVLFLLFVALYVLYFYLVLKCEINNIKKPLIVAIFLSVFVYSMFEDIQLFITGSANGFLITLLIVSIISEYFISEKTKKDMLVVIDV